MREASEGLFLAMMSEGWFNDTDGDLEGYGLYFGYVTVDPAEYDEVIDAFSDVIELYGHVERPLLIGAWYVTVNDQGIVNVTFGTESQVKALFERTKSDYEVFASTFA